MAETTKRYATRVEGLGIAWWNALTTTERTVWLRRANTAVPAVAWDFYQRQQCALRDEKK